MADALDRPLTFLRRLDEKCAERVDPWAHGAAFFHESLPRVWSLNFLLVAAGVEVEAAHLARAADLVQGKAGFAHRKLAVREDAAGGRLAPGFRALGWKVDPLLVMPHAGAQPTRAAAGVVEVERRQLEPVWADGIRRSPHGRDEDTVHQLVAQRRVIGEAGRARYFARLVEGRVASYCELYSDGKTGQIEGVLTVEELRGRGYANAVVGAALTASAAAGHDLTFLLALDEDWPKELYRKLGFEAAGRIWDFTREAPNR